MLKLNAIKIIVNRFGQKLCDFETKSHRTNITTAGNSTYPKGGVSCSKDTFVQAESSVLRMKFSGKNPALRVAAKRQTV